MAKSVDPLKLAKYKKARKQGLSKEKSLLKAGCTPLTANRQPKSLRLDKIGDAELIAEFKASDLTIDLVVKDIEKGKRLAITGKKKDLSTFMRGCELEGKYLKMFGENIANTLILISPEDKQLRLDRLKSLINSGKSNEIEVKEVIDAEAKVA